VVNNRNGEIQWKLSGFLTYTTSIKEETAIEPSIEHLHTAIKDFRDSVLATSEDGFEI
jgi:hypothetical protein